MVREDQLGTAQADLRRARDTGRTGGAEVDVVGGITGLILGVLASAVSAPATNIHGTDTCPAVSELANKRCRTKPPQPSGQAAPPAAFVSLPSERSQLVSRARSVGHHAVSSAASASAKSTNFSRSSATWT